MRWTAAVALLGLVTAAGAAGATARHEGGAWVLENSALKVTVQQETGRLSVLQKASGRLWEQEGPPAGQRPAARVKVRKAPAPPTIDGDDRDWANADTVWLPWVGEDGERNLSAGARIRWDEENLYLYVRVRDQNVAFGHREPQRWWEADSVEFWVDSVQVGLHLYPGATAAVDAKGRSYSGALLAVRLIPGGKLPGYAVEAAVPLRHFPVLKAPAPGVRFYFAVGVNDADPRPGRPARRIAQSYYPTTWVHSQPTTFAVAVLTDEDGSAPPLTKQNDRTGVLYTGGVGQVRAGPDGRSLVYPLTVVRGQPRPLRLEVRLRLLDGKAALDMTLSCPDGDAAPMDRLNYPRPLYPPHPGRYFMAIADYCDGHYLPVGDSVYNHRWLEVGAQLDMPWVAVTDGKAGMMAIAMTPEDTVFLMQSRRGDAKKLGFPGLIWLPSKGRWGHERRLRWLFFEQGGHVAACKAWRKIAQDWGMFHTLRDKAKKNPDVLKLLGAVDWWGADGLEFVRQSVAEGMRRGLVNGRWSPADMREMVRLGWLVGEYDNYVDIKDSPTIGPRRAPVAEHAVVKADGTFKTAWVQRDRNMKPVGHFMKHCTARQLECARAIIPAILEKYPYNARFLDVTSAESLIECYSPEHPTTRTTDRQNRQALQRYVSEELGLVTGGEHGRWWSVPYLAYHEGMMGGGHYSWPAGYLRDVTDRSQLSEDYLKYGINPANRAPLFELCYHDCVVDYWYWGACNDYLHAVAPEITDRKTAMNVLYGTPPMMWVHSHGLRWQVPKERAKMLDIYRDVCKLHEVLGLQEMLSHEFLTDDRMVQRTTWEDGTVCVANFGKQSYEVTVDGNRLVLGENDFCAEGPKITEWRADLTVTPDGTDYEDLRVIRTADYLFVDSGPRPFRVGGVTCRGMVEVHGRTGERCRITLGPASRLVADPSALAPSTGDGPLVLLTLDETGKPAERRDLKTGEELTIEAPAHARRRYLLLGGKKAYVPDVTVEGLRIEVRGRPAASRPAPRPGETMAFVATVRNLGFAPAEGMTVELRLDGPHGRLLAQFPGVRLEPGERKQFRAELEAGRADGERRVVVSLVAHGRIALTGRTRAEGHFVGPLDRNRFPFSRRFILSVPPGDSTGMAVEHDISLAMPGGGRAAPDNLRVAFEGGPVVPAQFEPNEPGATEGRFVFCLPIGLPAGREVTLDVLGVPEGSDAVEPHASPFDISPDGSHVRTGTYEAQLSDGTLMSICLPGPNGRKTPVIESIIVSSAETGWSTEEGRVERFRCVSRGPVRAVFECEKALRRPYRVRRRWIFYRDRIEIVSECSPRLGLLTRARYASPGTATNETGRSAEMDGKGEAENFGFQGKPTWYAVFSDAYRSACIALTPSAGFTYWDSGTLGQIGLNHGVKGPERRLYILGPGAKDDGFARAAAEAYARGATLRPRTQADGPSGDRPLAEPQGHD